MLARIVDIENLPVLMAQLHREEVRELYHRAGYLNVVNPTNPDGLYELDLRYRDQREMAKTLVKLAVEEPGENWKGEEYRWSRLDPNIPGWELPATWATEDEEFNNDGGPRKFGRLKLTYTSDPRRGCAPVMSVRKQLMERFLCGSTRIL